MTMLTIEKLDEEVEVCKKTIAECFAEEGTWNPTAFVLARLGPDGKDYGKPSSMFVPLMGDDIMTLLPMIRALAAKSHAVQVVISAEAWALEAKTRAEIVKVMEAAEGKPIRDLPDKIEMLILTVVREDNTSIGWTADIIRRKGRKPKLGPWKKGAAEGPMTHLFPEKASA